MREFLGVGQVSAVLPVLIADLLGLAGAKQSLAQIDEGVLGHGDEKRFLNHGACSRAFFAVALFLAQCTTNTPCCEAYAPCLP